MARSGDRSRIADSSAPVKIMLTLGEVHLLAKTCQAFEKFD